MTAFVIFFCFGEVLIRIYLQYRTVYDIEMTRYAMNVKIDSGDSRIGHVHKPNTAMRLMNVMVEINSDGMRDREYPISGGDKYRIIVLGDSLTFGWGVEQEDTFENILEENLSKMSPVEVLNFGAGNYNTEQEVNYFIKKGLKYKPDKVVLFYFINDAEITPKKSDLWFLGYSRFVSFCWSRINSLINRYYPSKSFRDYYLSLYDEGREGWLNARKALLQLKKICQQEGILLQVILLPELHDTENKIFGLIYDKLAFFLGDNGIDHLNLARLFKDHENRMELWVSYDDAHPNSIAHKRIAEASVDFISPKR